MYVGEQYTFGKGAVGATALSIAATKTSLGWLQALVLGAFCNALVCLAVWLTYGARTTTDKILAIVPPIAAFVAAGFEHSVANMYFIPMGLFIKTDDAFVAGLEQRARPLEPDLGQLPRRQPPARDAREHHRRRSDGRPRLLVRLPARQPGAGVEPAQPRTRPMSRQAPGSSAPAR